jgi:MFS family permease
MEKHTLRATRIGYDTDAEPFRWKRPPWLSRDLLCLFAARGLRSFAIGYIGIILPIYLADLGYNAVQLGTLFSISGLTAAALAFSVGILADRFGRKPFIILIALMMAGGSLALSFAHSYAVIVATAALGTIGFPGGVGGGGGWGPYYPAAQSLVAEQADHFHRTTIFGVLSFIGVVTGSVGSLAATLPRLLHTTAGISMLAGFRLMFLLAMLVAILMAVVVIPVHEIRYRPRLKPRDHVAKIAQPLVSLDPGALKWLGLSPSSWHLIWRFMVTNATNGLAQGMMGPFVVYWFYKRFGASAAQLGHLYFIINISAALPYLLVGRISRRLGAVVTIVTSRFISALMLVGVVAMPTYFAAASLYVIRVLVAVFAIPVRQSFLMGVISPAERSIAAGFANTPSQVSQSLSAYGAGALIQYVALSMPLLAAGVFQALNAMLYYAFFCNVQPPEEVATMHLPEEEKAAE